MVVLGAALVAAPADGSADWSAIERKQKCENMCRQKYLQCKESAKKKPEKTRKKSLGICNSLFIDCNKRCGGSH